MIIATNSLNPKDWKDNPVEDAERNGLLHTLRADDPEGNAAVLRKYYPFKARLRTTDATLGFQPGTVLKYARVRLTPHRYPIEVYFAGRTTNGQQCVRKIGMDSTEVELLSAE